MTKNITTSPLTTLEMMTDLLGTDRMETIRTTDFGTLNSRNNYPTSSKTFGNGTYTTKDSGKTFTTQKDGDTWTLIYRKGTDDEMTLRTGDRTSEDSLLWIPRLRKGDPSHRRMDLKGTDTDS